jgi:uncharacterized protein with ParB-like and HNH nuclease domain
MNSNVVALTVFLAQNVQYRAPLYQRRFRWNVQKARIFWDDLLDLMESRPGRTHFFGAMVLEPAVTTQTSEGGDIACYNVVDGQQRLITLSLFVSALSRHYVTICTANPEAELLMNAKGESDPAIGGKLNLSETSKPGFLLNSTKDSALILKFRPTVWDEKNFVSIIKDGKPTDARANPWKVFEFFHKEIENRLEGLLTVPEKVSFIASALRVLTRFQISRCFLQSDQDDPNQVFESINSKGERLSSVDLIRNFALMGFAEDIREHYFKKFWEPMEECLSPRDDDSVPSSLFPDFIRAVLVLQKGELIQKSEVFSEFKAQFESSLPGGNGRGMALDELVKLSSYAQVCKELVVPADAPKSYFERKVFDLNQLGITTHLPLLMKYKGLDPTVAPTPDQIAKVLGLIERYFVRRAILNKGVHGIGELFALLAGLYSRSLIPNDRFHEWLSGHLKSSKIKYNDPVGKEVEFDVPPCPNDLEIELILPVSRAYESNQSVCRYVLATLEARGEEVDESKPNKKEFLEKIYGYDLDHVMPQAWTEYWKDDIKLWHPDLTDTAIAASVDECVHQIGNLALSDYNRKMQNKGFSYKKTNAYSDQKCGSYETRKIGANDKWTFEMIRLRSRELTSRFKIIWPAI